MLWLECSNPPSVVHQPRANPSSNEVQMPQATSSETDLKSGYANLLQNFVDLQWIAIVNSVWIHLQDEIGLSSNPPYILKGFHPWNIVQQVAAKYEEIIWSMIC